MPLNIQEAISPFIAVKVPKIAVLCVGLELPDDLSFWMNKISAFVTEAEKKRAKRFHRPIDAARHLSGRALVRHILSSSLQTEISTDFPCTEWGKPYYPHAPVDFSISHAGSLIWTAFCYNGLVGVDVEKRLTTPDLPQLIDVLHPQEQEELQTMSPDDRLNAFYRCWARKEAVLKASGWGLNLPLQDFCVRTTDKENDWIQTPPTKTAPPPNHQSQGSVSWLGYDITTLSEYHCSVASCGGQRGVTHFFMTADSLTTG